MYRNVRVIPKQLLEQLYVEKQWSIRDVAEYFQCSVDTIMRRMKEYEIDRRPLKKDINMVHVQALYRIWKVVFALASKALRCIDYDDGKSYERIWIGLSTIIKEYSYRSGVYL